MTENTPKAAKGDPRAAANKKLLDAQKAEGEAIQAKHDATIAAVNAKLAETYPPK